MMFQNSNSELLDLFATLDEPSRLALLGFLEPDCDVPQRAAQSECVEALKKQQAERKDP